MIAYHMQEPIGLQDPSLRGTSRMMRLLSGSMLVKRLTYFSPVKVLKVELQLL